MNIPEANVAASHPERRGWDNLFVLLAVTLAARLFWLFVVMPPQSRSIDLKDWNFIAKVIHTGENPYENYPLLNWPPFWMESLALLTSVSERTGIHFEQCVRYYLIVGDIGLLVVLRHFMRMLDSAPSAGRVLLWGYALNPLLTILTVQHCNFDAYAMIWVTLFFIFTIKFRRGGSEMDWLWSAGLLGMGIFTKTFPILLWPVLMQGIRRVPRRARFLGAGMLVGPTALALAPLFVLSPDGIIQHVINYRGVGVSFGVMSILHLAGASGDILVYGKIYGIAVLVVMGVVAIAMLRLPWPTDDDLPLLAGLVFLALFTLGTGYGSQYWFWVFPMMLAAYSNQPGWFRKILVWSGAIVVLTNLFDYGFEEWLGGFIFWRFHTNAMQNFSLRLMESNWALPVIHLPMTLAAMTVIGAGTFALVGKRRTA
jgi:hypothetical protein